MTEETKKKHHDEEKPLEKMTVKELRAIAIEIPHTTSVHDMKKEELVAFIKEAKGIKSKEPVKKVKVKDSEKLKTKQDIKARIRLLKEEKIAAKEKKDRKKVHFLRCRLSRLKKQTRRVAQA